MASGRFETKCIGPLETVSLACNSGTVATVTLTATALSVDQNACLSISMSDVPTCPELSTCYGSIGTGQLGTLGCLISPVRSNANAYAGYRKVSFGPVIGGTSCQCGPYIQHYSAANTLYQICSNPTGYCALHTTFNIPPAIESQCYCANFSNCCCSQQKAFNSMYIPSECCGGYHMWLVKKCCFQRFGGTLTDDCYYQLISQGACNTCETNCSTAVGTPTAFGGYGRMCIPGCGNCDVAIDWWHNGKFVWAVNGTGCGQAVCAPFVHFVNPYTQAGCAPWAVGDNQDGPCTQDQIFYQCCMNNYPNGSVFCTYIFGGAPKVCCPKSTWGLPCASLYGFYPMVMTGCNLQVYQHAFASAAALFHTTQNCVKGCDATPWCGCSHNVNYSNYDCQNMVGLLVTPCGYSSSTSPDKAHNFVRWITYNHTDQQNYFMWYHQCTPVMNGIYSVSEYQLYCIWLHQTNYCNTCAGSWQCADAVLNTKFATRVSCVPAIWCAAYNKAWCMLNTNVFASGCCEWSMFASPTDWGTSALCFCRFVTRDLVNWTQHDPAGCTYKSELCNTPTVSCYIDFNASTCNFEYNCSNYAALPPANTAVLELLTTTGKLERSGIVMGATDRFYVRNTSNSISASVSVWGFNE